MTACWNEDNHVMEKAKVWKEDVASSLEKVNAEMKEVEQHPIGAFRKPRHYFNLSERRRKLAAKMDMLDDTFPPSGRLFKAPNNMVFLKEGVIAVKRLHGGEEQYHWVGTFALRKISKNVANGIAP